MPKIVKQFRVKYGFLSNFYPAKIKINGLEYATTEHYFQSMKFTDMKIREKIKTAPTPGLAKKWTRKYKKRKDWYNISVNVMERALRAKFSIPKFRKKLLATGDMLLQEGNTWGDKFWGVDLKTGKGENILGKLLMKIREEIKRNSKS